MSSFVALRKLAMPRYGLLPIGGMAQLRMPGFFRTWFTNSVTVLTGRVGWTTRADGPQTVAPTGTKLFSRQRRFAYICGLAVVAGPMKVHVYPSGLARETWSQARLPLAPGFASTTIGWCQISGSLSVTMRVAMSTIPPAG